jgi:hypothetical protein
MFMKKTSLSSGKGIYSYSKNPMAQPSRTSSKCGPGMNADQQKTDRLLQKAFAEKDYLRGKSGM